MKIKNPILTGFNPDPCIIKAKDKYYIATSTFEVFPGISIHESKDLVNWKLVSHPLNSMDIIDMFGNSPSSGVWAPDITYHNGLFYIVFSNMRTWCRGPFKDTLNFIITSESITGPWSKPKYINSSGFDASLFHDDNGKSYFVNMEWDFRQGRGSPCFTGILVQEIDLTTMKLIGDAHKIFKGTDRGLVEAPRIYKINEYYYLLCAEGGTDYNHAESVCRSKDLFSGYELHPNKYLISSKDTDAYLQRAGHGALVDGGEEGWFFAHLCGRPISEKRCILGRETALQNVLWKDGWPYLANMSIIPRDYYEISKNIEPIDYNADVLYEPNSNSFMLDFQTLRIPMDDYTIRTNDSITLIGQESVNSMHTQNTWQRRLQHFNAEFSFKLEYNPKSFQHMAGLIYRYQEGDLYFLYSTYDEKYGKVLRLFTENEYMVNYYNDIIIPYSDDIYLKCIVEYDKVYFQYSLNGIDFINVGPVLDSSLLSDEYVKYGGFTGSFFGIHACDLEHHKHPAKFMNLHYKKIEK